MTTTLDELTFVKAFLSLLNVSSSTPQLANDYVVDPAKLGPKPLTVLSGMPNVKRKKGSNTEGSISQEGELIQVTVKSIRAPKFSVTLDQVSDNDTVLSVKEKLIIADEVIAAGVVSTAQIKLVIKGKVIPDSKVLADLKADDSSSISFVAMIQQISVSQVDISEQQPDLEEIHIPDTLWTELGGVLVKSLGETDGEKALKRLRNGWIKASD